MEKGSFSGRRSELEEEFFRKRDAELLQALREQTASKKKKEALACAAGIDDEELLDQLIELEVCGETAAALSLIPLIVVAWADGNIDDKERNAILTAAESQGVEKDEPGHDMLERWLTQKPEAKLLNVWKNYVGALLPSLTPEAKDALKTDLLGRARSVAQAAGGILGFGNKISKSEQAALDDLERVFG